jgi:hypothetical protein
MMSPKIVSSQPQHDSTSINPRSANIFGGAPSMRCGNWVIGAAWD